jgi:hypothetical protein
VWPFCEEVEVPAHSVRCREERCGEIDARPAGQLGRCQGIADRAQVVELELVRSEPLEQAGNHVLVNSRFASQQLDDIAQVQLAAVELSRLSSQLGKFPTRLCRLVPKSRVSTTCSPALARSRASSRSTADGSSVTSSSLRNGRGSRRERRPRKTGAAIVRRLLRPRARPHLVSGACRFRLAGEACRARALAAPVVDKRERRRRSCVRRREGAVATCAPARRWGGRGCPCGVDTA